jgi:tetratricopeptide (TPR) repeat protein
MAPQANSRIQHLERFLEQDSSEVFTRYALALEYTNAGQLQQARLHFQFLLDHNPNYLASYYHFGRLLKQLNEPDTAIDVLRTGVQVGQQQRDFKTVAEIKGELAVLLNIDEDDL